MVESADYVSKLGRIAKRRGRLPHDVADVESADGVIERIAVTVRLRRELVARGMYLIGPARVENPDVFYKLVELLLQLRAALCSAIEFLHTVIQVLTRRIDTGELNRLDVERVVRQGDID